MFLFESPGLFAVSAAIVGLCVGSFLNVVIHRLPRMLEQDWLQEAGQMLVEQLPEGQLRSDLDGWLQNRKPGRFNLVTPRSRCPVCSHQISALENIPVLSYLFLRGRCRHCQTRISVRYPLVELLTAALSGAVAWKFGAGWETAAGLLLVWTLIALAFIDLDTFLLPDNITLPLLWLGLLFNLKGIFVSLEAAVIGAIAGYLALWSVYWLFYGYKTLSNRLLGRDDQREGMGFGDFKLLAAIGAFLGWKALPAVILLSSLVGAIVGICLMIFARHGRETPIPFGPYIAAAGILALLLGDSLRDWGGVLFPV